MLSKRQKPYDDDVPAPKRLAANVLALYADNQISCLRAQSFINDMADAGVAHLPAPVRRNPDNVARTLRRNFLKNNKWPKDYWAQLRVLDRDSREEVLQWCPIMLPLEIMDMLVSYGNVNLLSDTSDMDPISLDVLIQARSETGVDDMLGFGLHCDGVPHSWDREESAEVFSCNLPGIGGRWRNMRIPMLVLPHSAIGPNTWDDVLEVFAWSLIWARQGVRPPQRHDRVPWLPSDCARAKKAGQTMDWSAAVVEIRGDWKMLKETFHLPGWNEKGGICWDCTCKVNEVCQHMLISTMRCSCF